MQSVVQEALEVLEEKPVPIVQETLEPVQETRPGNTGQKLVNQEAAPVAEGIPPVDQETAPVVEVPRVIEETTSAVEIQSPVKKKKGVTKAERQVLTKVERQVLQNKQFSKKPRRYSSQKRWQLLKKHNPVQLEKN